MRALLNQVDQWRAKADELRAVADTLDNAAGRDQLRQMADGYEGLAKQMEALELRRHAPT